MKKYKFIVMLFILILWFPAFSQETDSEDSDTETLTADSDAAKIIVNKYRLGDGITFSAPDGGYNINLSLFLSYSIHLLLPRYFIVKNSSIP